MNFEAFTCLKKLQAIAFTLQTRLLFATAFLRHIVSNSGVSTDPEKVQAIVALTDKDMMEDDLNTFEDKVIPWCGMVLLYQQAFVCLEVWRYWKNSLLQAQNWEHACLWALSPSLCKMKSEGNYSKETLSPLPSQRIPRPGDNRQTGSQSPRAGLLISALRWRHIAAKPYI